MFTGVLQVYFFLLSVLFLREVQGSISSEIASMFGVFINVLHPTNESES